MRKIVISGAMILAASTAYAATSPTTAVKTLAKSVTVIAAPATTTLSGITRLVGKVVGPVARPATKLVLPERLASNFNVGALLIPSWGSGELPRSGRPDVVGAFRFICTPGQVLRDDPIVFPGQPGKSHLHQFFGNTSANAYSTYGSLRNKGDSTCGNMLNRSAYWVPAMLDGKGKVVRPDFVSIYYKRLPENDPNCQKMGKACVALPRGLRYIFGYNMATDKGGNFHFSCEGPTAVPGNYPDIVSAAKNCPVGNRLGAVINGPDCWDGANLNSSDHRTHVAYGTYGAIGRYHCPSTHPYVIPAFTLGAWYTVDENLDTSGQWAPGKSTWSLSSDTMPGMAPKRPGTTFHADWLGAWDDDVLEAWTENCINKLLSCNGGDLGNGKQMKEHAGFSWNAKPRLVDIPAA
ncbi:DUF1996 domain-containing protein [Sphingomonas sp. Leaf231]|uniref:DUF1996 domain-containing protein n=1 Tax=Sphingomonas sp. Leaf231 TaxID=1736301 RepID=UPI000A6E4EF0|nr:DUF1996 domain-containing protein [Sphingomonas sp. Leaf231]